MPADPIYHYIEQIPNIIPPFIWTMGQHPWKSTELRWEAETEVADVFVRRMQKIREETVAAPEKAASDMKKYYDEGRQDAPE